MMEWQALIPDGEFPELLDFHPTKDYVREVLDEQATLTAKDEKFVNVDDVPSDFRFFGWNDRVNGRIQDVPSHRVIRETAKAAWRGLPHRGPAQPHPRAAQPQGGQHRARPRAGRGHEELHEVEKLEEAVEREEVLA